MLAHTPMAVKFITAQDLAQQTDWLILDASYYLDGGAAKGEQVYQSEAIPGAIFWNIDKCADPFSTLPHMKANICLLYTSPSPRDA